MDGSSSLATKVTLRKRFPSEFLIPIMLGVILGALVLRLPPKLAIVGTLGSIVFILILVRTDIGLLLTVGAIPLGFLGALTTPQAETPFFSTLSVLRILGSLTLLSLLLKILIRKYKFSLISQYVYIAGFLLVGLASLFYTQVEKDMGIRVLGHLIAGATLFFLLVNIVNSRELLKKTITAFIIIGVLIALFSIAQHFIPAFEEIEQKVTPSVGVLRDITEEAGHGGAVRRSSGVLGHADFYVINLLLLIPLIIYRFETQKSKNLKVTLGMSLAVALAALLFTYTRAAVLVFILILMLMVIKGILKVTFTRVVLLLIAGIIIFSLLPAPVKHRIFSLESYTVGGSLSFKARVIYANTGLAMLKDNWLKGMGLGNLKDVLKYNTELEPDEHGTLGLHNMYLQTANEVGMVGMFFLLAFFYLTLRDLRRSELILREKGDIIMSRLASTLLICFVGFLVYGLAIDIVDLPIKDWWLLAALAPVMKKIALSTEVSSKVK